MPLGFVLQDWPVFAHLRRPIRALLLREKRLTALGIAVTHCFMTQKIILVVRTRMGKLV
jgi:hypothetical protein